MRSFLRQSAAALRLLVVFTLVLGLAYPGIVWLAGRVIADRADGSFVDIDGEVVASRLIGQPFEGDEWFLPRPSAGGYDALASGGSNLGPENTDLVAEIEARRTEVADREGVEESAVPPDAVTASWSGLDPHISPEYARLQVERVAEARGLDVAEVQALVEDHVDGRQLGFMGAPRVNVVDLNLALVDG